MISLILVMLNCKSNFQKSSCTLASCVICINDFKMQVIIVSEKRGCFFGLNCDFVLVEAENQSNTQNHTTTESRTKVESAECSEPSECKIAKTESGDCDKEVEAPSELIDVKVVYNKNKYDVSSPSNTTIANFKKQLQSLLGRYTKRKELTFHCL